MSLSRWGRLFYGHKHNNMPAIARQTEFDAKSALNKTFKEPTGLSPLAYVKQQKEG
jgi:transcriptional regulator GlxA family with amidase domain